MTSHWLASEYIFLSTSILFGYWPGSQRIMKSYYANIHVSYPLNSYDLLAEKTERLQRTHKSKTSSTSFWNCSIAFLVSTATRLTFAQKTMKATGSVRNNIQSSFTTNTSSLVVKNDRNTSTSAFSLFFELRRMMFWQSITQSSLPLIEHIYKDTLKTI